VWLLSPLALGAEAVGKCFGTTFKLNRFNVRVLTMHRWFDISAAERDLQYQVSLCFFLNARFIFFLSTNCSVPCCSARPDFMLRVSCRCVSVVLESVDGLSHAVFRCLRITNQCYSSLLFLSAMAGATLYRGSRWRLTTTVHCAAVAANSSHVFPPQANWLPAFLQTQGDSSASVVRIVPSPLFRSLHATRCCIVK
jgi:hypothetical protein